MAAAAVASPSPPDWAALQQQLGKKASFEGACAALAAAPAHLAEPSAKTLLTRCLTLLKTRYTARPFWVSARALFQAALPAAQASGDAAFAAQLEESIAECAAFLGEQDQEGGTAAAAAAGAGAPSAPGGGGTYLFEGQLSGAHEGAPAAAAAMGMPSLLDLLPPELAQRLAAAQAAAAAGQEAGEGQQGQQQQQAEVPAEVMESIQRELDAMAETLLVETAGGGAVHRKAPPASKAVVQRLQREALTAERLEALGGADARCAFCMEELGVGEEVQVMPCQGAHAFHLPCLAPWLADNNSCPVCRHELPTDDHRYEARKRHEEDAKGAANAVSHNDFLYI